MSVVLPEQLPDSRGEAVVTNLTDDSFGQCDVFFFDRLDRQQCSCTITFLLHLVDGVAGPFPLVMLHDTQCD